MSTATAYLVHYNPKAKDVDFFTPGFSTPLLAPVCKVRGRKDTTSNPERVTCTACIAKAKLVQQ